VTRHLLRAGSYQVTPPGPAPKGQLVVGARQGRQVHAGTATRRQFAHRSDPSEAPAEIFTVCATHSCALDAALPTHMTRATLAVGGAIKRA
jgi:hypothetical protein